MVELSGRASASGTGGCGFKSKAQKTVHSPIQGSPRKTKRSHRVGIIVTIYLICRNKSATELMLAVSNM